MLPANANSSKGDLDDDEDDEQLTFKNKVNIEGGLFGVFYTITREKKHKSKRMVIVTILLDFIQMLTLTINPDFTWAPEIDVIWKYLRNFSFKSPLISFGFNGYLAGFALCAGVLVFSLFICALVAYHFKNNSFPFLWPIKFVRTIFSIFIEVFFISTLNVFLMILQCSSQSDGTISLTYFTNIQCWVGTHILISICGILFSILLVITALGVALLSFEPSLNSKDYMASAVGQREFQEYVLKTMMTCAQALLASAPKWQAGVYFVTSALLVYDLVRFCPYYNKYLNLFQCSLQSVIAWCSTILCIKTLWINPGDYVTEVTWVMLGGSPVAFLVGGIVIWIRLASLDGRNMVEEQDPYAMAAAASAAAAAAAAASESGDNASVTSGAGASGTGMNSEMMTRATAMSTMLQTAASFNMERDDEYIITKDFVSERHPEIAVRFVQGHASDPKVVAAGAALLEYAIKQYPESAHVHIVYSSYILAYEQHADMAQVLLDKARQLRPSFLDRFVLFLRERERKQRLQAESSGQTTMDLVSYIEFQNMYKLAVQSHKGTLRALRNFWRVVVSSDVTMTKMSDAIQIIDDYQVRAEKTYRVMLQKYPKSASALRSFGRFLEEIQGDRVGAQKFFQEADKQEELAMEARNSRSGSEFGPDGGAKMFDERVDATVISNATGSIIFVNNVMAKLFGWKKEELIGQNVNVLMPSPIAEQHSKIMARYIQGGKSSLIGTTRTVEAKHRLGHNFIVGVKLSRIDTPTGITFMAMFRPVTEDDACQITINAFGVIQNCTKSLVAMFGYDSPDDLVGQNVQILMDSSIRHDEIMQRRRERGTDLQVDFSARRLVARRADGTDFPISMSISRIGDIVESMMFTATIRDIGVDVGVISTNEYGSVMSVSKQAADLIGWSGMTLVGQNVARIMPPPYAQFHDYYLKRYKMTGHSVLMDSARRMTVLHKDGTLFECILNVAVTETAGRKTFLARLKNCDSRMEETHRIDSFSACSLSLDEGMKVCGFTGGAGKVFGEKENPQLLIGRFFFDLFIEDDMTVETIGASGAGGILATPAHPSTGGMGEICVVRCQVVRHEPGVAYRLLIQTLSSLEPVVGVQPNGMITYANNAAILLFGSPQLIGMNVQSQFRDAAQAGASTKDLERIVQGSIAAGAASGMGINNISKAVTGRAVATAVRSEGSEISVNVEASYCEPRYYNRAQVAFRITILGVVDPNTAEVWAPPSVGKETEVVMQSKAAIEELVAKPRVSRVRSNIGTQLAQMQKVLLSPSSPGDNGARFDALFPVQEIDNVMGTAEGMVTTTIAEDGTDLKFVRRGRKLSSKFKALVEEGAKLGTSDEPAFERRRSKIPTNTRILLLSSAEAGASGGEGQQQPPHHHRGGGAGRIDSMTSTGMKTMDSTGDAAGFVKRGKRGASRLVKSKLQVDLGNVGGGFASSDSESLPSSAKVGGALSPIFSENLNNDGLPTGRTDAATASGSLSSPLPLYKAQAAMKGSAADLRKGAPASPGGHLRKERGSSGASPSPRMQPGAMWGDGDVSGAKPGRRGTDLQNGDKRSPTSPRRMFGRDAINPLERKNTESIDASNDPDYLRISGGATKLVGYAGRSDDAANNPNNLSGLSNGAPSPPPAAAPPRALATSATIRMDEDDKPPSPPEDFLVQQPNKIKQPATLAILPNDFNSNNNNNNDGYKKENGGTIVSDFLRNNNNNPTLNNFGFPPKKLDSDVLYGPKAPLPANPLQPRGPGVYPGEQGAFGGGNGRFPSPLPSSRGGAADLQSTFGQSYGGGGGSSRDADGASGFGSVLGRNSGGEASRRSEEDDDYSDAITSESGASSSAGSAMSGDGTGLSRNKRFKKVAKILKLTKVRKLLTGLKLRVLFSIFAYFSLQICFFVALRVDVTQHTNEAHQVVLGSKAAEVAQRIATSALQASRSESVQWAQIALQLRSDAALLQDTMSSWYFKNEFFTDELTNLFDVSSLDIVEWIDARPPVTQHEYVGLWEFARRYASSAIELASLLERKVLAMQMSTPYKFLIDNGPETLCPVLAGGGTLQKESWSNNIKVLQLSHIMYDMSILTIMILLWTFIVLPVFNRVCISRLKIFGYFTAVPPGVAIKLATAEIIIDDDDDDDREKEREKDELEEAESNDWSTAVGSAMMGQRRGSEQMLMLEDEKLAPGVKRASPRFGPLPPPPPGVKVQEQQLQRRHSRGTFAATGGAKEKADGKNGKRGGGGKKNYSDDDDGGGGGGGGDRSSDDNNDRRQNRRRSSRHHRHHHRHRTSADDGGRSRRRELSTEARFFSKIKFWFVESERARKVQSLFSSWAVKAAQYFLGLMLENAVKRRQAGKVQLRVGADFSRLQMVFPLMIVMLLMCISLYLSLSFINDMKAPAEELGAAGTCTYLALRVHYLSETMVYRPQLRNSTAALLNTTIWQLRSIHEDLRYRTGFRNPQVRSLLYDTGCLRLDQSTCRSESDRYGTVVRKGLDGLLEMYLREAMNLADTVNNEVNVNSTHWKMIDAVAWTDLMDGLETAKQLRLTELNNLVPGDTLEQVLIFFIILINLFIFFRIGYAPFQRKAEIDTHRSAILLSLLPDFLDLAALY